jgi:hypothetical protein
MPLGVTRRRYTQMTHYVDMFSPLTFEAFSASDRSVSGFRERQLKIAQRIHPGDRFVCYMTKVSRWVGLLEVASDCYLDSSPRFYEQSDPFVVRFRVNSLAWLPRDHTIPIREPQVWDRLSFTRGEEWTSARWKGMFRYSLRPLAPEDASFLEQLILAQLQRPTSYPVDEAEWRTKLATTVRRPESVVPVTVPEDAEPVAQVIEPLEPPRQSSQIQATIARIGETMGFSIWIPRGDRGPVGGLWTPQNQVLLDTLPLNYNEATLKTIEQIDVIWLKRGSIVRAFEVEHTTSVYSGLLRMADLLALSQTSPSSCISSPQENAERR